MGIADKHGYIFVIRCAPPSTTTGQKPWSESMVALREAMIQARKDLYGSKKNFDHRRGNYETVSGGISFGGGQKVSKLSTYTIS